MSNDATQSNAVSDFLSTERGKTKSNAIETPSISLPKGGGAIKGIDEKFSVNAVNGTASFSIPLPFSTARGAVSALSLSYNSGAGNSVFGLGWDISLTSIKRKTDKRLPQYHDDSDSDVFVLSDVEDLVPVFAKAANGQFRKNSVGEYIIHEVDSDDANYLIRYYQPRIEGLFARIERWTHKTQGRIKWRVITRDNVTTLYGWSDNSIIADPESAVRIYQWLPEFVFDDKGNCSQYRYQHEDATGLSTDLLANKNRIKNGKLRYTNAYLVKVLYGNKTPYKQLNDVYPSEVDYMFQTVFDYGEYDTVSPYAKINDWRLREDAFSDYKAGFEIRTTRLCQRVLVLHNLTELGASPVLVKSLNFGYDITTQPGFSYLHTITSWGYIKQVDGVYSSRSLPPMEFQYQAHDWNTEVKSVSVDELVHAPVGLDESSYQFTDLFNEGIAGILSEQATGWFYKHNLGNGKFSHASQVTPKPSFAGVGAQLQLMDLDADGNKQLVSLQSAVKGYFEIDDDSLWQPLQTFSCLPNIDLRDANTRLLDLDNDGKPDVLITEDQVFTWYPSQGKAGFDAARCTVKSMDEEAGPHIVFANATQSIYLADMSGDGLTDIVRIHNGAVCYWPNLGYGRFGNKVAMDHAPLFDQPDSFNPAYLRLVDIDGSGTTDIIYLGNKTIRCWMNLNGNGFSVSPFVIDSFSEIHNQVKLTVTDLLGNGVACIVWSNPMARDAANALRYIDLMNSKKPHIMTQYKNNMGKEISLEYAPSAQFYLEDKQAGKPWVTKLHFPVHCLVRTETRDRITGSRFVSSYKYHHGYYDHAEREFRGFGMVEQTDSEDYEHWKKSDASNIVDSTLHQQPVITKSWFHTGAFIRLEKILNQFADDYWYAEMQRQGYEVNNPEKLLQDARLVAAPGLDLSLLTNLGVDEWREALRACKGSSLRTEVFANDAPMDATPEQLQKALTPYSVATHNCVIELLQPKGQNRHAIYIAKESESINYNYERDSSDSRIAHTLNIKYDEYANVLESAAVVYPRVQTNTNLPLRTQQSQAATRILYSHNKFTNDVNIANAYRTRLVADTSTFELSGVAKTSDFYVLEDFENILLFASDVAYSNTNMPTTSDAPQKRLIEQVRTLYRSNNLVSVLPLGKIESLALSHESYQLAYTPELLVDIFQSQADSSLMLEGKYTQFAGDGNWWVRSGTTQYIDPVENPLDAQNRFYVPIASIDPYGSKTQVRYYSDYYLFVEEIEDAISNKQTVEQFDFRALSPARVKDANGNFSEILMDELGMVKAMAVLGKGNEADDLNGLSAATSVAETSLVESLFNAATSVSLVADAKVLLQHASARFVYDLAAYQDHGKPVVVASIQREQHFKTNSNSALQISFEYADGMGQIAMKKSQAEPGNAKQVLVSESGDYTVIDTDTAALNPRQLRWIGNGRKVQNNKGKVVKQYEPYFSVTHQFENLKELIEAGVTPILYYDAVGRLIKTILPDGTFSRTEFDAWQHRTYDPNDTILESFWYQQRSQHLIDSELLAAGKDPDKQKQAADKTVLHANTPVTQHFDTLGRAILSINHNRNINNGADEYSQTRVELDIEGNLRKVIDARGNVVMQYKYDMLGNKVYQRSMDAGQRWLLLNVVGRALRTWDERQHEFQYFYDILHRPTHSKVLGGDGTVALNHIFDRIMYGEAEANPELYNLRGHVVKHFDTAGVLETLEYDFKGKPIATTHKLFKDYKGVVNWLNANLVTDLESEAYTFATELDALGRISRQTAPDGSVITPSYNETGLLQAESVRHPHLSVDSIYIKNIVYNVKGQYEFIVHGNDVVSRYYYDRETFRLNRLQSMRQNNDPLQDWHYTYDPSGNITHIEDKNIPTAFFNNQKISGVAHYTYDALYRLVAATGREHDSALTFSSQDNWSDASFLLQLHPGDPMAMRNYTQTFLYDPVGNIIQMKHQAAANAWVRHYNYQANNNRLINTQIGVNTYGVAHHAQHGFISALPHLEQIDWNFKEELIKTIRQRRTDGGTAEATYYQYDAQGQRLRKITENSADVDNVPTKKDERIYLDGYEVYKQHSGTDAGLERISLSLLEQQHRFVMVDIETRPRTILGIPAGRTSPEQTIRYQFHNHLGSAALELNETAQVISYEEYHPYGTTAFQARNASINAAAKRYRYTGMERDEESGLEYHAARYYVPWLARWLSADPIGIGDGLNVYAYCKNNPVLKIDKSGTQTSESGPSTAFGLTIGNGVNIGICPVSAPPNPNANSFVLALGRAGLGPGSYMDRAEAATGLWSINIQDGITISRNTRLGRPLQIHFPTGPAMEGMFLTPSRPDNGGLFPMFSGVMVQEALEGNQARTVFSDMRGVDLTPRLRVGSAPGFSPDDFHSSSEARQVVAHLASTGPGERAVDVVIAHEDGISTIPRDANRVAGSRLPSRLADRMPNISNDPDPTPPTTPRGSWGNAGANALTQVVPGATEALIVTESLAPAAARLGMPRLFSAALAGARSPGPAVVGGIIGAPAGVMAESVARDAGLGDTASTGVGLGTSVAVGAGVAVVGVLVVATAPVSVPVLAGAALVGGLAAGFGYLSSKLF